MSTPCASLSLFLLLFAPAISQEQSVVVILENPADIRRESETVSLPLKELAAELPFNTDQELVVLDLKTGDRTISQMTEDQLLFQTDFPPGARKEFVIRQSTKSEAKHQSLVDGRFVLPREDYAWENDRIAFRMYGPALAADVNNGIDVWTKRVKYLIVDKWYSASAKAGKDTYHEDHGEGADFFSVGRTLGAGSSGIWLNGRVHQPGVFSSQRTIHNGPIRVTFELTYSNWNVNGTKFTERKRISLDAGQNLNRIEVTFEGLGANDSLSIACGLVKRSNTAWAIDEQRHWMGLWGMTNNDTANGFLGTAVILPLSAIAEYTEDKDQFLSITRAASNETFTYYAGAGWSRNDGPASDNDWKAYLDNVVRRLKNPIKYSITTK